MISGNRIKLINCTQPILQAILIGDDHLSKVMNIKVPDEWSEFGKEIFKYSLERLEHEPNSEQWYSYLPIGIENNTLLGSCGYKGTPRNGVVEIGYEVAKDYRGQGFATEIVEILISNAFNHMEVKAIQAHTLAEENASVSVLKKHHFQFVEEFEDDEDGLIWKWLLKNNRNGKKL